MPALRSLLSEGLLAQIESATGATVKDVRPRGAGGASREGAKLILCFPDGHLEDAYMNYDVGKAGAGDDAAFMRESAILHALSSDLASAGVRAPRFIAALPESRALLTRFVAGEADFRRLDDPRSKQRVAVDFMRQLATLHAIDVSETSVPGLGPVQPPLASVRAHLARLRARHLARGEDPLIHLSLSWLERHEPATPARAVIVHGDAGPGNFLFESGQVTALLDWELVHYGDPMADLAMLAIRTLFQPFITLPEAFAAYEAAGGAQVNLDRVRYYRLLFLTDFVSGWRLADPEAPRPPSLGTNLMYATIQRRALCEALGEGMQVSLPPFEVPEGCPGAHDLSFEIALEDLRDSIAPAIADRRAAVKVKGLVRLIKWWRESERLGPALQSQELQEHSRALGEPFSSLEEARTMLRTAILCGTLDGSVGLRTCYWQACRDAALMARAMGSLTATRLAPLE